MSAAEEFTGTERFRIIRRIGAGGMGVVYEALDREWNRRVALKTLSDLDPHLLYLLKKEFRALADIAHPNLARFHELIFSERHCFFTMELVEGTDFVNYVCPGAAPADVTLRHVYQADLEGETVFNALSAGGVVGGESRPECPARIELVRDSLLQLAEGVHALHSHGKLHCDIKPANIMVKEGGHVVLLDFGLAIDVRNRISHSDEKTTISGTVAYMAPEQAAGLPLLPAADWYAVGCTLYQGLTGRLPFTGNIHDVLHDKQHTEPPPPGELASGVPEDLDRLCVALLHRRPEDRPGGEEILASLSKQHGRISFESAQVSDEDDVLVGRETHLEALLEALASAQRNRTVLMLVSGESGYGKSALIGNFLDQAEAKWDAKVLRGRCYEQESVPYKAFDTVVDALARWLESWSLEELREALPSEMAAVAQIFPVLRAFRPAGHDAPWKSPESDPLSLRRTAFAGLRKLIRSAAARQPLIVAIDDLQWGDHDSALLLGELIAPPDDARLMIVCSYRSEHAGSSTIGAVHDVLRDSKIERRELVVGPLGPEQSQRLALSLLGSAPDAAAMADRVARESKGSPFFIHELSRFLHHAGSGARIELEDALWTRVSALPAPAQRMLEVVAVSGQPIRQAEAFEAAVIGKDPYVLNLLRASRLVRAAGHGQKDEIEIYHDRVRETVAGRLPEPDLANHHRRLAETLTRAGSADPERLAVHWLGAKEEAAAGRYFDAAGDRASDALAFDRACTLYQRSLDLLPEGSDSRAELDRKLADAFANAGRGVQAARQYLSLSSSPAASDTLGLLQRAAYHFCASGHVDEGRDAFRRVLAHAGERLPANPRATILSILWHDVRLRWRGLSFEPLPADEVPSGLILRTDILWSAAIALSMVDIGAGADLAKRGLLSALETRDPARVAFALAWEGVHAAGLGPRNQTKALHMLSLASGLAADSGDRRAMAWSTLASGVAHLQLGNWRESLRLLEAADRRLREYGRDVSWELATANTCYLLALNDVGDFVEMERRAPGLLDRALERGNLYAATNIGTWVIPQVRLARDQPDAARRSVAEFQSRWSNRGFHLQHLWAMISNANAWLYEGEPERALDHLQSRWTAASQSLLFRAHLPRAFCYHVRARACIMAAARATHPDALLRRALADASKLDREHSVWTSAAAGLLRAAAARIRRRETEALELLRQAERAFQDADMGAYLAAVRRRLGSAHRGASDEWMAVQRIADPERMTELHAPGLAGGF